MKAIMISIKPKWCAKIMNGEKTIEVRKNKGLYKAIQTLISMFGYVEFYGYCSKGKPNLWLPYEHDCFELDEASQPYLSDKPIIDIDHKMNGKVIFKFRCYKVEEIDNWYHLNRNDFAKTCLTISELVNYIGNFEIGYAIHISDLEIFDKPKDVSEFYNKRERMFVNGKMLYDYKHYLTKAPQNFCYVEVEEDE